MVSGEKNLNKPHRHIRRMVQRLGKKSGLYTGNSGKYLHSSFSFLKYFMAPSKVPPTANVIAKDFHVTGFKEDTESALTTGSSPEQHLLAVSPDGFYRTSFYFPV